MTIRTTEADAPTTTAVTSQRGAPRKPWEQWADEKKTPAIDRRRAPLFARWAVGKFVTEAEFDAAVTGAASASVR